MLRFIDKDKKIPRRNDSLNIDHENCRLDLATRTTSKDTLSTKDDDVILPTNEGTKEETRDLDPLQWWN